MRTLKKAYSLTMENSSYTYRAVREAESPTFLAGVKILTRRKYFFGLLLIFAWAAAYFYHKNFPKYVSASEVFVRSSANSLITSLGTMDARTPGGFGPEKNALEKYLNYFGTFQYSNVLAKELLDFTSAAAPPMETNVNAEIGDPKVLFTPEMHSVLSEFMRGKIDEMTKISEKTKYTHVKGKPGSVEFKTNVASDYLESSVDIYESRRDTIQVRIVSEDKNVSVHLSNFILGVMSRSIVNYDTQELLDTKNYLDTQIKSLQQSLRNIEKEFLEFIEVSAKENFSFSTGGNRDNTSLLKALEESVIELKQNNTMIDKIREQTPNDNLFSPHLVNILKQNAEALRIRRNKLLMLGVELNSRQIKTLDEQIKTTDEKLRAAEKHWKSVDTSPPTQDSSPEQTFSRTISTLQSENRALNARINSVRELLRNSANDSAKSTQQKQKMDDFSRKITFNYVIAENLQKKLLDIEIQKVSLNSKVKVIETANILKVKHKIAATGKMLIATILAVLFGILFSYVSELFDTTIKSRHDLIDIGLNVFGTLPAFNGKKGKKSSMAATVAGLTENHETIEEMALKQIRSRIIRLRKRDKKEVQVFAVLSSIPGEGKSYFATNMARVLAQLGQPTLFIDSDVRRPSAPRSLGYENTNGISQVLSQGVPWRNVVQRIEHANMDVIAAGPMNEHVSEAFASDKLRDLLIELRSQYRFIVIDCPPVLPVADGLSIASFTDANFLVCSMHLSNKGEVAESLMRLSSQSSEPILGILNRVVDHNRAKYSHMYLARSQEQIQKLESMKNAIIGRSELSENETRSTPSFGAKSVATPPTTIRVYPRRMQGTASTTRSMEKNTASTPSSNAPINKLPVPPTFNKPNASTPQPPPFKGDLKKHG